MQNRGGEDFRKMGAMCLEIVHEQVPPHFVTKV